MSNPQMSLRPCTIVWMLLISLTVTTYLLGELGLHGSGLIASVLAFALIKGNLIADWYMGLRNVGSFWRPIFVLYLVIIGLCISAAFLLPYP